MSLCESLCVIKNLVRLGNDVPHHTTHGLAIRFVTHGS